MKTRQDSIHSLLRRTTFRKKPLALASAIAAALTTTISVPVFAETIEEVVTIGSRVAGRTAAESATPIDVIASDELTKNGFTELGQSLQTMAPSFNFTRTQVSDGSDLFRPATLRGLQPDQTLVLINGKRRHTQSIFQNSGTVGGGSAGTDMNAIPITALKAVEVLRDGAAAQYGSDAIAGVINLQLKDTTDQVTGFMQWGQNGEGDGDTLTVGLNGGVEIGDDGGFINLSLEYRDFDETNRANNGWFQGDASGEFESIFFNAMIPLGQGELYAFGGYSNRTALGYGFRRRATSAVQNVPQVFPDGFLPNIDNEADDYSFAIGYRQELNEDWSMDASVVYGENSYDFTSRNTINASIAAEYLFNNPGASDADIAANSGPSSGYSGGYGFDQTTYNIDFSGSIEIGSEPLYIAIGAEYRDESYEINAGVLESWSCGTDPNATTSFPSVMDTTQFAGCGFQAFTGVQPDAAGSASRDSYAIYADFERNLTENWLLAFATRYEDYEIAGDELTGKLSTRIDFNDTFALRGAIATGFRAPALQQSAYQAYQTNISNTGVLERSFTAGAGTAFPTAVGVSGLEIETSQSFSAGLVVKPTDNITITLDYYTIDIDDRIVLGSLITAADVAGNTAAENALIAAGVNGISFFSNAVDTNTEGVDLIITYNTEMAGGVMDITLAANLNDTDIEALNAPPGTSINQVLSPVTRSSITGGQPNKHGVLSFNWANETLSAVVRFNYFGETEIDFFAQNHIGIPGTRPTSKVESNVLVDLNLAYDITENLQLSVGGNNIFDERPDKLGNDEVLKIISGGGFNHHLRAVPYGFNGSFYYAKMSFKF